GALRLHTRAPRPAMTHSSAAGANAAAVAHWCCSPHATLTAIAGTPTAAAVSAAPTVPECKMRCPVLAPGLMPEATASGRGPNAPSRPAYTAAAGGASIAYTGIPGRSAHSTWVH